MIGVNSFRSRLSLYTMLRIAARSKSLHYSCSRVSKMPFNPSLVY